VIPDEAEGRAEPLSLAYAVAGSGWQKEASLTTPLILPPEHLGESVAVDGLVVAVREDHRVHIYDRSSGTWQWQGFVTAGEGLLSGGLALDEDVLAVGVRPGGGTPLGAVRVFERTGGAWSWSHTVEPGPVTCPEIVGCEESWYGRTIVLDGDRMVVGAGRMGKGHGRAYVLERIGGVFQQTAELQPPDDVADQNFGNSVALEGDTIAVGQPGEGVTFMLPGAVHVFRHGPSGWALDQSLALEGAAGGADDFGAAVALAAGRLAVRYRTGAQLFDETLTGSFAYQAAVPASTNSSTARRSIALSATYLVIGNHAGTRTRSLPGSGYVSVYTFSGGAPVLQTSLTSPHPMSHASFGAAVAVSGRRVVVGGPGTPMGEAHVYRRWLTVGGATPQLATTVPESPTRLP
jgi:hypothetical protein